VCAFHPVLPVLPVLPVIVVASASGDVVQYELTPTK
jgi:hypothetical protein